MDDIPLGNWREETIEEQAARILREVTVSNEPKIQFEVRLETSDSLRGEYKFFEEHFGTPTSIVYPCCGPDITLREVFPSVPTKYIDKDERVVAKLTETGIDACCVDATTYAGEFDLLVIQNPQLNANKLVHLVKTNGLILANNYHRTAAQLFAQPNQFAFLGLIDDINKPTRLVNLDAAKLILAKYCDVQSVFRKL